MGIRQKILLILALVLVTTLSLNTWLVLDEQKTLHLKELKQRGEDISHFLAKALAYNVIGYDYHTIQLLVDEITASNDVAYAKVLNRKGKIMAETGHYSAEDTLLFEQPIKLEKQVIGKLILGMDKNQAGGRLEASHLNLLKQEAIIILLIIIGEFIALSFFIIKPLRMITRTLQQGARHGYENIDEIPVLSDDEFGLMAREFNQMSRKLIESNRQLQLKVEAADRQLLNTNKQLVEQSAELKKINEELHKLSITDALTKVYNRRYFDDQLCNEVEVSNRYGEPTSLLLIDLDHFKVVNDVHGHYAGDVSLQAVAQELLKNIRKTDLLCRVGGEEFAVICKHTGEESAMALSEKLRQSVENLEICLDSDIIRLTTSIGVATIPESDKPVNKDYFFLCADRALYSSKAAGRNKVTHCQHIDMDAIRILSEL